MNLQVEIKPDFNGSVQVIDRSREFDQYIPEESTDVLPSYGKFKYSDTCTIDILSYVSSQGEKLLNVFFTPHDSEADSIRIPLPKDGYYSIYHIVLPTLDWYDKVHELDDIEIYKGIYLTDSRFIYKIVSDQLIVVDPIEVIQRNIQDTTISLQSFQMFSIDRLKRCYVSSSRALFSDYLNKCKQLDGSLRFNRDFLWMTINVIDFYLDENRYSEAQLVLEELNCSNFCPDNTALVQVPCGCQK